MQMKMKMEDVDGTSIFFRNVLHWALKWPIFSSPIGLLSGPSYLGIESPLLLKAPRDSESKYQGFGDFNETDFSSCPYSTRLLSPWPARDSHLGEPLEQCVHKQ